MNADVVYDVLADRYATAAMKQIWSEWGKVVLERELWLAVLRAQKELGLDIPDEAIQAYEAVKDQVDLESIRARERRLRHDVKARIEEFCALAGYEHIHKGLTSRDLTDNVEQLQILRSLQLLRKKAAAALYRLAERVEEYSDVVIAGRTHNIPAQATTVGKRLAMFGEELLAALEGLESLIERYPLRGLKGAVGTQLDELTLFEGDADKVQALEDRLAEFLGFSTVLGAIGQVYPRSLDFDVVSSVYRLGAPVSSLAKTARLMAGQEQLVEGFKEGQIGSSAMPHKINPRSCERINGFQVVLNGFLNMAMGLSGDQWNEGDVSCSVVRRVALPGTMFAADGMLETFLTVMSEMRIFPAVIEAELRRYLPFLATTTILMEAVKKGAGREEAHAAIRDCAVRAIEDMRAGRSGGERFLELLAADKRVGLTAAELQELLARRGQFTGRAQEQALDFAERAKRKASLVPGAREYSPGAIL